jgi:acyl carrier protein
VTDRVDSRKRYVERVQAVLRTVFDDDAIVVSESTSLGEVAGWDQALHLDLVTAIEKAFGVRLTTREVSRTSAAAATVGSLVDVLSSRVEEVSHNLRSSLEKATSGGQRRRLLEGYLREQVVGVLGTGSAAFDPGKAFLELGMTSLTAVEFCSRLGLGLGLSLAPTVVYNYPNLVQLVPYLAGKIGLALDEDPVATSGKTRAPDALLEEIDRLSEEEAERLLADESDSGGDLDG